MKLNWAKNLFAGVLGVGLLLITVPCLATDVYPILLDNHEVVFGRLERLPGVYRIRFHNRGYAVVPRQRVLFAGPDMAAVFAFKKSRVADDDIEARTALTEWCLQQRMLIQAADQIDGLAELGVDDEQLDTFRQRLKHLQRPDASGRSAVEPASYTVKDPGAGVDDPADAIPAATSRRAELLRGFTSQVQPILIRGCGSANCHGYSSQTDFRVRRPPGSLRPTKRITAHNMTFATLYVVDEGTGESPLLEYATQAHGGAKRAAIRQGSPQHKILQGWVAMATGYKQVPLDAPSESEATRAVIPAVAEAHAQPDEAASVQPASPAPDPFDPARFNQSDADDQD